MDGETVRRYQINVAMRHCVQDSNINMFKCCFLLNAFILLYQSGRFEWLCVRIQMGKLQFRVFNMAAIDRVRRTRANITISVTTKAVSARERVLQNILFIFFTQLT